MAAKNPAKRKTKKNEKIAFLENQLENNVIAIKTGPKKKEWSTHDLKTIKPLTSNQKALFQAYYEGSNIMAHGCPGTGKTFLASALGINDVLDKNRPQNCLIFVRSIVPTRDIGFLPGDIGEKTLVYEQPYREIFEELFGKSSTYNDMKEAGLIKFIPTSFVRGLTWDNCIVILDEFQNMNMQETHSIMTRLGMNSRVIICGDNGQNDLASKRGEITCFDEVMRVTSRMSSFQDIKFEIEDIVRSGLVREWMIAKET